MPSKTPLQPRPITLRAANAFVAEHHSYLSTARGCKFTLAVESADGIEAVVIASRPVSPHMDDGVTLELSRCVTRSKVPRAMQYAINLSMRIAANLGYDRVITYCDAERAGTAFHRLNFRIIRKSQRTRWHSRPDLPAIETPLFVNCYEALI